jgi:RNase P/RNase MRP subunit p30
MKIDIVFPSNNEEEFVTLAQKLGWDGICFVYDSVKDKNVLKKINELNKLSILKKFKIYNGLLVNRKTIQKFNNKTNLTIIRVNDNVRNAVEKIKPNIIFNQENVDKSDFIHQRNSGINHVICNIAKKNDVNIAFSFQSLLNNKLRTRIMGRVRQNVKLCKKYDVNILIASFSNNPMNMRSPDELKSLFINFWMHPKEADLGLRQCNEIIMNNEFKKSDKYITDGVEIIK